MGVGQSYRAHIHTLCVCCCLETDLILRSSSQKFLLLEAGHSLWDHMLNPPLFSYDLFSCLLWEGAAFTPTWNTPFVFGGTVGNGSSPRVGVGVVTERASAEGKGEGD